MSNALDKFCAEFLFVNSPARQRISLLSVLCLTAAALPGQAQDLNAPLSFESPDVATSANIATVPSQGISGRSGRSGYYTCSPMTWGQACAGFYEFGTVIQNDATNGRNAPSSGTVTNVESDASGTVSVVDYDPGTVNTDGFSVEVTRLAGTVESELINSQTSFGATEYINDGASFDIEIEDQLGNTVTLNYIEVDDGFGGYTGGASVQDIADDINEQVTLGNLEGLTASVIEDPDNAGQFSLSIEGVEGDDTPFTIEALNASSTNADPVGTALTDLTFEPIQTQSEPVQAEYTVSGAASNGTFTSDGNEVVVDGVVVGLVSLGTANFSANEVNAGVTPGTNGNPGNAATALVEDLSYGEIAVAGDTAVTLDSTGGDAGQAGQGGKGGNGGAGGAAVTDTAPIILFSPFPPFTVPSTRVVEIQGGAGGNGATGGAGGNGAIGGTGGAIDFALESTLTSTPMAIDATSTGGFGGTGGLGGLGGNGGNGANATASIESNNLLPVTASAAGDGGGTGGTGGVGGVGGTGGTGGQVVLSFDLGEATVDTGARAQSLGGQGGAGGQGGQGGTGGTGGAGIAYTDFVLSGASEAGRLGGTGGTGGSGTTGGTGGQGGAVSLTNSSTQIQASDYGLIGLSRGGTGGTGGQGGTGGTGGTGGAGDEITNYANITILAEGGDGGTAGSAGAGGDGGTGGAGGLVEIFNTGDGTIVAGTHGILAQSTGGIGGLGGTGGTGGTGGRGGRHGLILPIEEWPFYGGAWSEAGDSGNGGNGGLGGNGGDGGNGGTVSVENAQTIATTGTEYSSAIRAESLGAIGGGGGAAGAAGAGGAAVQGGFVSETFFVGTGFIIQELTWNDSSAGSGGSTGSAGTASFTGGDGGDVSVDNTGDIATSGTLSDGIMGISMGGVHGLAAFEPADVFRDGLVTGNQTGGAGNVALSNTASIITSGTDSAAISALSVGAGEASGTVELTNSGQAMTSGDGAHALIAASRVYQLGSGTAQASGGVTVSNVSGSVTTGGADATGIWAESSSEIGDAQAVSVDNSSGMIRLQGTGEASAIYALSESTDTGGGNAGDVTIDNVAGVILGETGGTQAVIDARSLSASGDSGAISFDNINGSIQSDNTGSVVILQTLASTGTTGGITGISRSSIVATADGATALTLDSTGLISGDILFDNGGLIEGGSGGTAIAIIGGTDNVITNDDSLNGSEDAIIRTAGGVFDTVITGTTGNDSVQNLNGAYIGGSITLGAGANYLLNTSGSLIETGAVIDVGAGNLVENDAFFSPGGLDEVLNSANANGQLEITGDFTQTANGQMLTDVNFSTGGAAADFSDFVNVSGTATLNGYVTLNPATGAGKPGDFKIPLLTAGTLIDDGIEVFPTFANGSPSSTVVFTPSLLFEGDTLNLVYQVDYNQIPLSENQEEYASNVNDIQTAGIEGYQPVAFELLEISDETEYRIALDSLTGEGTTSAQHLGLEARGSFMGSVLSNVQTDDFCSGEESSRNIGQADSNCTGDLRSWAGFSYQYSDQRLGYANPELHLYNAASSKMDYRMFHGGFDAQVTDRTRVGLAFSYTDGVYSVPDRWTQGHMDSGDVALYFARGFGANGYLKGLVSAGWAAFDQDRSAMGRPVSGYFETYSFGAQLEAGVEVMEGITPFVGMRLDRQRRTSFTEDDVTWGNTYDSQITDSQQLHFGVDIEREIDLRSGRSLALSARVAGVQEFATERALTAAPASAPDFKFDATGAAKEELRFNLEVDATLINPANGTELRGFLKTGLGTRDRGDSVGVEVRWSF
ncbi:Uncharacterized conserved protein, contains a C-terminal beta-barrel porin domain [Pseudooceanicola antarcticus]|uniref:Uncharacterized conserved protein, contains a C-terminal beta-barrel porin domain n=1 Tax=Pseudooceanicola antarcticus TaxID=1247613 RepID=A0A285J1E6_9RHOB|nr:autotransporter outer membrane beta-barrel domain-containing protein [Pseudooceanicola antarcticus]SNY54032.1 Uncharacterized conserved protein, contains a C-terminal beta-barrel porin domain [Pseudooceanicola antarcticus]